MTKFIKVLGKVGCDLVGMKDNHYQLKQGVL